MSEDQIPHHNPESNHQRTGDEQVRLSTRPNDFPGLLKGRGFVVIALVLLAAGMGVAWNKTRSNTHSADIKKESSGLDSLADYYNAGKEIGKQNDNSVTFLAVGDIMLSRTVASKIDAHQKNADYPFRNMNDLLLESDFNFGNLESPISGQSNYGEPGSVKFNAPQSVIDALKKYKFEVLSLANNHMLDQGKDGLMTTLESLRNNGIQTVGAGKNQSEAWQSAVVTKNGIKIGILSASYASANDGGVNDNNLVARTKDLKRLKSEIESLKTRSDYVVVMMHAGTEYTRKPNVEQITFAHSAVDYGADLIIGAHPHWIQTTEKYQGKYIFYSLGNFIFDQEWSRDTKEGLALKISLQKNGAQSDLQGNHSPATLKQIDLIPIIIEDYSTPRPANDQEAKNILRKIDQEEKILY